MKYYFITCDKNWADEFNTYSYQVMTEDGLEEFKKVLAKFGDAGFRKSFGTNQGWGHYAEDETVADVWRDNFEVKEIPEEHYRILSQYVLRGSAPRIADLMENMYDAEEEDFGEDE